MTEKTIVFKNNDLDIKIKELENRKFNGLHSSYLKLKFEGSDFNIKIMNMIRRSCTNNVPVYAYAIELINIIENTSVAFNNDMMRLDLSLLPIFNIDPEIYKLDEEYWYNVNYTDKERKKHHMEKNIEFYVNYHNNSQDIVRVTTNDSQVYIDGKQIEMYDKKYPILLIELKPNQTFKCHMKGVLGSAERRFDGALWKSCKRAFYEEIKNKEEKSYEFTVYGNNQFSEYELLNRTCQFLINKLENLKKMIKDKDDKGEFPNEKTIRFIFENEDHTIGEPINYELQDNENIIFSGFAKADHLIKTGVITASCAKDKPVKQMLESIDVVINKVHKIGYLITKMNKKEGEKESESEKNIKKKK